MTHVSSSAPSSPRAQRERRAWACALRVVLLLAVGLSWIASSELVRADPAPEAARAGRLFEEARALMERQEYGPACAKLEESLRLDPQLGTQLHLGHCFEKQGQLLEAYAAFQGAVELAAQRNARGMNEPREKVARERASSLESRLSLLELRVSTPTPSLAITLDGVTITAARWKRAIAIVPGEHLLRASAPGHRDWQQSFTIGAPARLGIDVPALSPQPLAAGTDSREPPLLAAPVLATSPTPSDRGASGSVQRIAGYTVLGAGVVGLGLGAVFGLLRNGEVNELEKRCDFDAGSCVIMRGDTAARSGIESLRQDAATYATAATWSFILGGAAVAGGLVLVLTAPHASHGGSPPLTLGIAPGGLSLTAHSDAF
ncbi:MAG: hypothetical protein ABW321_10585 [Polyangiales bacterium]